MTTAGIVTTIGLLLALIYLLKQRADHRVIRAWIWVFVCLCGSTAAVSNRVPPDQFVYWYGVPALTAVFALTVRFWQAFDWRAWAFISIFVLNTAGLYVGAHRVVLGLGVSVLTLAVWLQIGLLFLMGRRRIREDVEQPTPQPQPKYDDRNKDNLIQFPPPAADPFIWWWDWVYTAWQARHGHARKKHQGNRINGS